MSPVRFLIVNDNEMVRRGVRSLLATRLDWSVCGEASDAQDAVEKTKQLRPDVVLMDVSASGMDGVEATRIIRREFPESEVLLVSQNEPAIVRQQAKQAGAFGFVPKSELALDLLPTVDRLLNHRNLENESQQRLRLALIAGKLGTWELDLIEMKLTCSTQCKSDFGRSANDLFTYEEGLSAIHPEDRAHVVRTMLRAIEERGEFSVECRCIWPDFSIHWISANGMVLRDQNHQPVQVVGVTQDVSQWKLAQERERQLLAETVEATAKFRAVFDQSAVFAGIMTVEGTVIEANRMCLEACGYRAEDVIGKMFWDTGWWSRNKEVQEKIRVAIKQAVQGIPFREELPYHLADGTERIVDFWLHPIRDDQGRTIFLHPTGMDITERKVSEENFRKLTERLEIEVGVRTKELEDRNSDVLRQSDLLQVLSRRLMEIQDAERRRIARELHDSAGQLLAALSINLSDLASRVNPTAPELGEKAEECQEMVQQITREIRTMSYLLHPPLLEEIGLSAALSWYVKGLSERSGLEIDVQIAEDFGRLPGELELAIFRVVQECLTNIHRHSGSKTAEIRLAIQGRTVLLEVRDQGKGIPPKKLAELRSHGSGVGIQGIRERLRPYHGKMEIESDESGTRISVTFQVPQIQSTEELSSAQAV